MIFMGFLGIWVLFMIFWRILWNVWEFYGILGNYIDFLGIWWIFMEKLLWDRKRAGNVFKCGMLTECSESAE